MSKCQGGERKLGEGEEGGRGRGGGRGLVGRPRLTAVSIVWHKNRQEMHPLEEMDPCCCCYNESAKLQILSISSFSLSVAIGQNKEIRYQNRGGQGTPMLEIV